MLSGDTRVSDNVIRYARGVDLLGRRASAQELLGPTHIDEHRFVHTQVKLRTV